MRWLLSLVFVCIASVSAAQTIHAGAYPWDAAVTAYGPTVPAPSLSGQCQIRPANSNPDTTLTPNMVSPSWGHTHLDAQTIYGAEVSQNFVVPITVKVFNTEGSVSGVFGNLLSDFSWDAGPLVPDPNALVTKTGHVTVNFSYADGSGYAGPDIPKRGWFTVQFTLRTWFANGRQTDTALYVPFYSMLDPTAPETTLLGQHGAGLGVTCGLTSPFDTPPYAIGEFQVVQIDDVMLPILSPLRAKAGPPVFLYGYAGAELPPGTGMIREDMDLHHGILGTVLGSGQAVSTTGLHLPSPFDPAVIGLGTHNIAFLWSADSGAGIPGVIVPNEQATAVLVVSVTVPDGTTPAGPTLVSLSPNAGTQGSTVPVMLTGTNFTPGITVVVSGAGVTVSNVVVSSNTMLTATVVVAPGAAMSARTVTVTTANGTSNSLIFTVTGVPTETWSTWILQHSNLSGNLRACPDASGVGCVGVMKN